MSGGSWREQCKTCQLQDSCIFRGFASYCSGVIDARPIIDLADIVGSVDKAVDMVLTLVPEGGVVEYKVGDMFYSPGYKVHVAKNINGSIIRMACGAGIDMREAGGWIRAGDMNGSSESEPCEICYKYWIEGLNRRKK
jgi:hypothetical protein